MDSSPGYCPSRRPASSEAETLQPARLAPASILVIDVGGTNVKILATGQTEPRQGPQR